MIKGIDVSDNNGMLDWDTIKANGIDFANIRVGYGSNYESQDDRQAIRNMQECERLNIPYGVYLYSYALSLDEAQSESEHALRMIEGFKPRLGIYIDMEDADGYKVRNGIVPEENGTLLTKICNIFMEKIRQAGYNTGTYANKNYFDNILIREQIREPKWMAIWGPESVPVDWAEIWQYSSDGEIAGSSARTDVNYYINEARFNELCTQEIYADHTPETPIEEAPIENAGAKYKVGDHVFYNRIYSNAGDWTDGVAPYFTDGIITAVYKSTRHPYLINDGTGFVDDTCITGCLNTAAADTDNNVNIHAGCRVRFTGSYDYNGIAVTAWHNDKGYICDEPQDDRVILRYNGEIFSAVNISDIELFC